MEFDRLEALRVGQELKKIRRQRGLSLAEVESISGGCWKAVVVGSYERADRAITVGRLSALMAFYQAPVSAIFPSTQRQIQAPPSARERELGPLTLDLNKRSEMKNLSNSLERLLSCVINARGDWNGHVLTLRTSDIAMLAICEGLSTDEFIEFLRQHRLLALWR